MSTSYCPRPLGAPAKVSGPTVLSVFLKGTGSVGPLRGCRKQVWSGAQAWTGVALWEMGGATCSLSG